MNTKKILYVSNVDKQNSQKNIIETMLLPISLEKIEIIALLRDSNIEWLKAMSNNNIDVKILNENICFKTILKIADQSDISLIIFASDEKNNSDVFPILKKVIKKTDLPFLLVNENDNDEIFKHPVTAVNWSAESDNTLYFVLKFRDRIKELEIVNVINKKLTVKDIRELKEKLQAAREFCLDQEIDTECHIYAGNTSDEILLSAKDYKSSLIAVGRKNKKAKRLMRNNTAWHVCRESKMPVIVV